MLIPLTDPKNPYATMMLELIGDHQHLSERHPTRHDIETSPTFWARRRRRIAAMLGARRARAAAGAGA